MSSMLWIDLETSGLSDNAAVLELAAIPYIDGQYGEPFQIYIRPHAGASIDPEALRINGIDPKKMLTFTEPEEAIRQFIQWIDKHEKVFTLAAHNIAFDKKHLFVLFCRTQNYGNFGNRFRFTDYCTLRESKILFKNKRTKPSGFSLGKLCEYFKIEHNNAHSALPDIEATIKVYEELRKLEIKEMPMPVDMTYQQKRAKYSNNMAFYCINPEGGLYVSPEAMRDYDAMMFIMGEVWDIIQTH